MMKISTAFVAAFGLLPVLPAIAQDASFPNSGRYDKTIETAAAQRVASKLGELRGPITGLDTNLFVTHEHMQKPPGPLDIPTQMQKKNVMPPMVMGENIDPVITGGPFKFDSNGRPMPHHQDRSMSRPPSLVGDLLKAMEINPYPGDL